MKITHVLLLTLVALLAVVSGRRRSHTRSNYKDADPCAKVKGCHACLIRTRVGDNKKISGTCFTSPKGTCAWGPMVCDPKKYGVEHKVDHHAKASPKSSPVKAKAAKSHHRLFYEGNDYNDDNQPCKGHNAHDVNAKTVCIVRERKSDHKRIAGRCTAIGGSVTWKAGVCKASKASFVEREEEYKDKNPCKGHSLNEVNSKHVCVVRHRNDGKSISGRCVAVGAKVAWRAGVCKRRRH